MQGIEKAHYSNNHCRLGNKKKRKRKIEEKKAMLGKLTDLSNQIWVTMNIIQKTMLGKLNQITMHIIQITFIDRFKYVMFQNKGKNGVGELEKC